jgi:hypothetical protein
MLITSGQQAITQSELRHQQNFTSQGTWMKRISHLPTIIAYLCAVVFIANIQLSFITGHSIPPVDRFERWTTNRIEDFLFWLAAMWTVLLHFRLLFKSLSLSTYSIARERESKTWETLLLTGIDARAIVRGKWWASARYMGRNYAVLGGLQALVIVWAIGKSYFSMFYSFRLGMNSTVTAIVFLLLSIIAILFVIGISFLNLGLTTACGLLSATDYQNKLVALFLAIGLRLFIILSLTIFPIGLALSLRLNFVFGTLQGSVGLIIVQMLVTLADNGFLTSYLTLFSTPLYAVLGDPNRGFQHIGLTFLTMIFSPMIYVGLTLLALHFAERNVVRKTPSRP